mgnify:CR=1 FL=1
MIIDINNKSLSTENDDFWIAPDATVIGDVQMAKDSSIWFHCTVRGDNEPIILGEGTNIQDILLYIPIQALDAQLENLLL